MLKQDKQTTIVLANGTRIHGPEAERHPWTATCQTTLQVCLFSFILVMSRYTRTNYAERIVECLIYHVAAYWSQHGGNITHSLCISLFLCGEAASTFAKPRIPGPDC